jgi:hypothetical protein
LFGLGIVGAMAGAGLSGIATSQGTGPTTEVPGRRGSVDANTVYTSGNRLDTPYQAEAPAGVGVNSNTITTTAFPGGAQHKIGAEQAAAIVAAAQGPPIGAGGCYPTVSGIGRDVLQQSAHATAAANWSDNARSLYGIGNVNNVQNLQRPCERESRSHAIRRWICTYSAQPCLPGGTTTPDPLPACYPALAVEGSSEKFQSTAENRSYEQWQRDAGNAHGADYRTWTRANNRDISCRHNGLGPLQRRWICTARGEPCR